MRWQCSYLSPSGIRCTGEAVHRIHFSSTKPSNCIDLCKWHFNEFTSFIWAQLEEKNGKELLQ